MEKKEIEHLATLARIELTDPEAATLSEDITSILGYVGAVNEIVAERSGEKSVGALYNVMRDDVTTHEADEYSEVLLDAAPERKGRYVQVKKILDDQQ